MKIIKGEKLRYGRNAHIPENLIIGVGAFIIVVTILGFINSILSESVETNTLVASILFGVVGIVILFWGIKLKLELKAYVDKFLYMKEKGNKAKGKIKKGYSYVRSIREDGVRNETSYYQLKISYFDEQTKKTGTFITPPLPGDINTICDDKVDVYYYNGEAVFDNLAKGANKVEFAEGIHRGNPSTDTEELKNIKNMEPKEMLKTINKLKKQEQNNSKNVCNLVTYEEEK